MHLLNTVLLIGGGLLFLLVGLLSVLDDLLMRGPHDAIRVPRQSSPQDTSITTR